MWPDEDGGHQRQLRGLADGAVVWLVDPERVSAADLGVQVCEQVEQAAWSACDARWATSSSSTPHIRVQNGAIAMSQYSQMASANSPGARGPAATSSLAPCGISRPFQTQASSRRMWSGETLSRSVSCDSSVVPGEILDAHRKSTCHRPGGATASSGLQVAVGEALARQRQPRPMEVCRVWVVQQPHAGDDLGEGRERKPRMPHHFHVELQLDHETPFPVRHGRRPTPTFPVHSILTEDGRSGRAISPPDPDEPLGPSPAGRGSCRMPLGSLTLQPWPPCRSSLSERSPAGRPAPVWQVFEPRGYVALLRDLIEAQEERPPVFGVIAIREGNEVGEGEVRELHPVGRAALLTHVAVLGGQRFFVIAEGTDRFRLDGIDLERGHPVPDGNRDLARRGRGEWRGHRPAGGAAPSRAGRVHRGDWGGGPGGARGRARALLRGAHGGGPRPRRPTAPARESRHRVAASARAPAGPP